MSDPSRDLEAGGLAVVDGDLRWTSMSFPLLFIGLGVVAMVSMAAAPSDEPWFWAVGLVGIAISPWVLHLVGITLPDIPFIGLVMAPIWFVVTFGERLGLVDLDGGSSQLVLMLLIGITGQVAGVADVAKTRIVTALAVLVIVCGAIARGDALDFGPWLVGVLLAAAGGWAFQTSFRHLAELRETQAALADKRVADERRRIAREVHDIVAHTMSVTMLHLTAARLAVRTDPDAAEAALAEAERHGRSSMDDIRNVVRLLREDESSLDAALPDETSIAALIDQFRSAGTDVDVESLADLSHAPGPVRLAAYRVVQESLSNASRYGRGPVRVATTANGSTISVAVDNWIDGSVAGSGGTGLAGMRERVEALGGTLEAGATGDGRWRVDARMPA